MGIGSASAFPTVDAATHSSSLHNLLSTTGVVSARSSSGADGSTAGVTIANNVATASARVVIPDTSTWDTDAAGAGLKRITAAAKKKGSNLESLILNNAYINASAPAPSSSSNSSNNNSNTNPNLPLSHNMDAMLDEETNKTLMEAFPPDVPVG